MDFFIRTDDWKEREPQNDFHRVFFFGKMGGHLLTITNRATEPHIQNHIKLKYIDFFIIFQNNLLIKNLLFPNKPPQRTKKHPRPKLSIVTKHFFPFFLQQNQQSLLKSQHAGLFSLEIKKRESLEALQHQNHLKEKRNEWKTIIKEEITLNKFLAFYFLN